MSRSRLTLAAALTCSALAFTACATPTTTGGAGASSAGTTTITNCGTQATFPSPAQRMYVYDGGMIAMALAVGAEKQVAAITGKEDDLQVLHQVYGKAAADLHNTGAKYPTLEGVLAERPDVMVAGYNYGFSESRNLMPEMLKEKGIAPYILSESCRPKAGEKTRGTMDPWLALKTDLSNLGAITGHSDKADAVNADIDTRLEALRQAPQAQKKPVVLLYDSGKDSIFTSGSFGGPQGIIDAAGATNLAADVKDTWTTISWEKVAKAKPDFITFVDYGEETMADKVKALEANPATRNLPAVKEKRYLNLPYAAWVSSPLNIDAAEDLRKALEKEGLVPASQITPGHDLAVKG